MLCVLDSWLAAVDAADATVHRAGMRRMCRFMAASEMR